MINSKTDVTVVANNDTVISVNHSVVIGKSLYLLVKGHTTTAVNNVNIFSWNTYSTGANGSTFAIGTGDEWGISGVAYGYIGSGSIVSRLPADTWFHVCLCLPIQ